MNKWITLVLMTPVLLFFSCQGEGSKNLDTPTSGKISIVADESLSLLVDAEEKVFEGLYKKATIDVSYKPEALVFKDFLENKTNLIVVSRELTPEELKVIEKLKLVPRTVKIASDAIAFVNNKENEIKSLTPSQLKELLSGKITQWNQLDSKSTLGEIKLIYDNKNSSTVRYIKEKVLTQSDEQITGFAVDSTPNMVKYIKENKDALGVMGVSWVSDHNDSLSGNFLSDIQVLALKDQKNEEYQPYQAYIAQNLYPYCRNLYVICSEPRTGLASGFTNFMAGDKGQRIILKSGLVPSTMPVRIVGFKE